LTLVAGAALTWLLRRFLPSRWPAVLLLHRLLPFISALAAIVAIWSLRQRVSPSRFWLIFPPTLGLDLSLQVQWEAWGRLFGLFLLWPALVVAGLRLFCSSFGAGEAADSPVWSQWLLLLAAVHVVLAAADWLTLAAALVLFDLVYLANAASGSEREWAFLANGLGGLAFLVVALVFSWGDHSLALTGGEPLPPTVALLITAAVLLRLGPYPFHFWLPDLQDIPLPAWRWPLRLLSPMIGLYLMSRIAPRLPEGGPVARLVLVVGIVGCLIAALLAWLSARHDLRGSVHLMALYQTNVALVSWAVFPPPRLGFWIGLALVVGITTLAMHRAWLDGQESRPLVWWSAVPGGLAAAALAGLPLTVGLFVRQPLYSALLGGRQVGWLALLLVAEAALVTALLRLWEGLRPGSFTEQETGERPSWSAWGTMASLAMPLLLFGLRPSLAAWVAGFPAAEGSSPAFPQPGQLTQGGIGVWATLLLPLVLGYGIYRSEVTWPDEMAGVEGQLTFILRLGWLHRAVIGLLGQVRQALWTAGAVLHGEGYLAWVSFSLLLIFLLVLSR
jgi:hypothetical protein